MDPPAPSASVSAAPVTPKCATEGWLTFGHDARRTSVSGGCCTGPLKLSWSFAPEKLRGSVPEISHAVADDQFIYAVGIIRDSPAAWKLDWSGKLLWQFDSRVDIQRGHWPTLAHGSLLVYDDGLYVLDPDTGKNRKRWYLDAWGNSLADDTRFYVVNTWHVAGPKVRVAALDPAGNELWHRFGRGKTREDIMDDTGAIALQGETLFYATDYKFGEKGAMIAALDPRNGETKWVKPTRPTSPLSLGCGKSFGFEKPGKRELVARSQADGEKAWSAPLEQVSQQPPLIVGTAVIVETEKGVSAFECNSGRVLWSVEDTGRSVTQTPWATSLIAASGSDTLVLTRGREVHVLRTADGALVWKGQVTANADLHSPVLVGERLVAVEGKRLVAIRRE